MAIYLATYSAVHPAFCLVFFRAAPVTFNQKSLLHESAASFNFLEILEKVTGIFS